MAKAEAPKTTKLVYGEGDNAVTVTVSEDQADALVGGNQFTKPTTKSTK